MWDLGADSFNQIGVHEQPITCCGFAKGPNYECLVTGSLDKTVKLWDMRQSNPVMTFNCPEVQNMFEDFNIKHFGTFVRRNVCFENVL